MLGVEGYDEMLRLQAELWPNKTPARPACWDVSANLGNSQHIDPDCPRSYAVWFRTGSGTRGWYFLFPEHGVALRLRHGTAVSWDGRTQRHCTAVPVLADGDDLYSLFAALPADACAQLARRRARC